MNEFQWLNQARALKHPVEPRSDLWPGIAERLATPAQPARTRRSRLLPWAMAASLAALSVLACTLAWRQQAVSPAPHLASGSMPAATSPWKPRDPRLTGAAIELHIARQQLTRAIRRAPHDVFLQRMLQHTHQQLVRLQQLEQRAG